MAKWAISFFIQAEVWNYKSISREFAATMQYFLMLLYTFNGFQRFWKSNAAKKLKIHLPGSVFQMIQRNNEEIPMGLASEKYPVVN